MAVLQSPKDNTIMKNFNKSIEENGTSENVRCEIAVAIAKSYDSGNPIIRSITKDGSKPTVEEFLEYFTHHFPKPPPCK